MDRKHEKYEQLIAGCKGMTRIPTAVDGLPMGTRSGALDPGVLLYLMDELKMDSRAIDKLLEIGRTPTS